MSIFFQFLVWQFIDMPKAILIGWRNFLVFGSNYFSVPLLIKTYFSYWRRYGSSYGRMFEFWRNFETFIFNIMSRVIGVIFRTFFIIAGIIAELLIFIIGLIVFLIWLILPFFLIFSLIFGIKLLF